MAIHILHTEYALRIHCIVFYLKICYTNLMTQTKPSLVKQLGGAALGGAIALGIYYSYNWSKPYVNAYLLPNTVTTIAPEVRTSALNISPEKKARIQATLAKAIVKPATTTEVSTVTTTIKKEATANTTTHSGAPGNPTGKAKGTIVKTTIPAPVTATVVKHTPVETHVPRLPDSGIGISAICITAIGAAVGIRRRQK
jgi:hypothetical protein